MKSLFSLIFLFLFANSAFAANLCDTSCNLTITFPSGGSIEATEALMFTFGTGGVLELGETGTINTAVQPNSTDFSAGGELALTAGESITFDEGGLLDLGTGGTIDYTSITVTTDGEFDMQVESVVESVYVGDIIINGTGTLRVTVTGASVELGSIVTNGDVVIIALDGSITATGTNVIGGSVSLSSDGDISLADIGSTTCTISSDGSLTVSATTSPTISTCSVATLDGVTLYTSNALVIDPISLDATNLVINTINLTSDSNAIATTSPWCFSRRDICRAPNNMVNRAIVIQNPRAITECCESLVSICRDAVTACICNDI